MNIRSVLVALALIAAASSITGGAASANDPTMLDQLAAFERQDMGVRPTDRLHSGPMHAPTPNEIPGGQVITTKGLLPLLQGKAGVAPIVFDVLGGPQGLPNAIPAAVAAQPGGLQRSAPAAIRPDAPAGDAWQSAGSAGVLLPGADVLDVLQRGAARDQARVSERAVVPGRAGGMAACCTTARGPPAGWRLPPARAARHNRSVESQPGGRHRRAVKRNRASAPSRATTRHSAVLRNEAH